MAVQGSRRSFLGTALSAAMTAALIQAQPVLKGRGWLDAAQAAPDLTHDTFNGLFAFVLPGSDAYSIAQGVSTADEGGVDIGVTDVLIGTIDQSTPFNPNFSNQVAAILNGLATSVNPGGGGPLVSPFANLSFAQKAAVFQIMDGTPALELFGGLLPLFVTFFCYSEAGVFNPATRSLTGEPLGWTLCSYPGVADGRDELLGYLPGVPHSPH
jgi:opacity protein-like surface antigen